MEERREQIDEATSENGRIPPRWGQMLKRDRGGSAVLGVDEPFCENHPGFRNLRRSREEWRRHQNKSFRKGLTVFR